MRSNPYAGLQIDTTDDTQAMSQAKENANHRKTGRAGLALLVFGVALLAFWGAAEVEETKPEAPVTTAKADLPEALPETGSSLPLIGLIGAFATAASLGLRVYRRVA